MSCTPRRFLTNLWKPVPQLGPTYRVTWVKTDSPSGSLMKTKGIKGLRKGTESSGSFLGLVAMHE